MIRTLFADKRVVPVVGIVRIAKSPMRVLKLEKLVAMLARMTRAILVRLSQKWEQKHKKAY
jgi:hypothetical protein